MVIFSYIYISVCSNLVLVISSHFFLSYILYVYHLPLILSLSFFLSYIVYK